MSWCVCVCSLSAYGGRNDEIDGREETGVNWGAEKEEEKTGKAKDKSGEEKRKVNPCQCLDVC